MSEPNPHFLSRLRRILGRDADSGRNPVRGQPESVWCLDFLRFDGDRLILDGWALAPAGARPALAVYGVRMSGSFGHPRPDLRRVMPLDGRAPTAGFHAELAGAAGEFAGRECLEIQLCDEATMRPFDAGHSFYWPLSPSIHALPDPARRKRVHGDANADGFIIHGYTTFKKLSCALAGLSREWGSFSRILDWGCGCGRVFRHLPQGALPQLVGADIDGDNIEWCRGAFPTAEFHAVPLSPPTVFQADAFHLVMGISVFPHLPQPSQHAWLQELRRITRRGALLLVTIHGPAAGARQ